MLRKWRTEEGVYLNAWRRQPCHECHRSAFTLHPRRELPILGMVAWMLWKASEEAVSRLFQLWSNRQYLSELLWSSKMSQFHIHSFIILFYLLIYFFRFSQRFSLSFSILLFFSIFSFIHLLNFKQKFKKGCLSCSCFASFILFS